MAYFISENGKICYLYLDLWLFDHKTILQVVLAIDNLWTKLELTVYAISFLMASEVLSRQGVIEIHVYLTLPYLTLSYKPRWHTDWLVWPWRFTFIAFHDARPLYIYQESTEGRIAFCSEVLNTFPIPALCKLVTSTFHLLTWNVRRQFLVTRAAFSHFLCFLKLLVIELRPGIGQKEWRTNRRGAMRNGASQEFSCENNQRHGCCGWNSIMI